MLVRALVPEHVELFEDLDLFGLWTIGDEQDFV